MEYGATMRRRLFYIGALVLAPAGLSGVVANIDRAHTTISQSDQDFFWRASGGDRQRNDKATPLYSAIIAQNGPETERLLTSGASPNLLLSDEGWSVLMIASAQNDVPTMRMLKERGADLNYTISDPTDFSALSVALNFGIPHENLSAFNYLLDAGADLNATYIDRGKAAQRDGNGDAFTGQDIACEAATLGHFEIVNQLLARGYSRDFAALFTILKIRVVNQRSESEKEKARRLILAKLATPEQRKNIPALLDELRKLVGNEHQIPWDFNSPLKSPERDADIISLERIMKS